MSTIRNDKLAKLNGPLPLTDLREHRPPARLMIFWPEHNICCLEMSGVRKDIRYQVLS